MAWGILAVGFENPLDEMTNRRPVTGHLVEKLHVLCVSRH